MAGAIPPPPTGDDPGSYRWTDWYNKLVFYLNTSSSIPWSIVDKSGSNLQDLAIRSHANLQNILGSSDGYHISAAQYAALPSTFVTSFNTRTGAVTLSSSDVTTALTYTPAALASPTFTGIPAAPTAVANTNTTQIATTAFVTTADNLKANLASPSFTGTPSLPTGTTGVTQSAGNSTTALATTAFVTTADNLKANLASPTFTGTPAAPTAAVNTNTTQLATTAFVIGQAYATLASPTFTGTPAGPTAAANTNTTQLATTAFVISQIAGSSNTGPAFSAYAGSTTSLVQNVDTKVTFDTEEFDTNNNFASSRFTPTTAGKYQIISAVAMSSVTAIVSLRIYKNGAEVKRGPNPVSGDGFVSALIDMNGSTDYLEIYCNQNGITQNSFASSAQTYFQGFFVRT